MLQRLKQKESIYCIIGPSHTSSQFSPTQRESKLHSTKSTARNRLEQEKPCHSAVSGLQLFWLADTLNSGKIKNLVEELENQEFL